MREKLIELIKEQEAEYGCICDGCSTHPIDNIVGRLADHLIANGVTISPCKVGDTVYQADDNRVYPLTIKKLIYDAGHIAFDESAIGKSVFLTIEEAQRHLPEPPKEG